MFLSHALCTIAACPSTALYRKYRPQGFSEVVGQAHVTETLAREVQAGKVAHAYLFAGPRGTGKTTTARILAKALNCPNRSPEGEPCNVCISCVGITEGSSMDVIELDAASHNKVEDVREIRANVGTVASVGERAGSTFWTRPTCFLGPPPTLCSRRSKNRLSMRISCLPRLSPTSSPDTIRSRTQRFDFHPIGSEVLVRHLERCRRGRSEGFPRRPGVDRPPRLG